MDDPALDGHDTISTVHTAPGVNNNSHVQHVLTRLDVATLLHDIY